MPIHLENTYLLLSDIDVVNGSIVLHNEGLLPDQETVCTLYHDLTRTLVDYFNCDIFE